MNVWVVVAQKPNIIPLEHNIMGLNMFITVVPNVSNMTLADKAKELISKFNGKEKIEMVKISKSELEDLKSANKQYEVFFGEQNVDNKTQEEVKEEVLKEVEKTVKNEIETDEVAFKKLAEDTNKKE